MEIPKTIKSVYERDLNKTSDLQNEDIRGIELEFELEKIEYNKGDIDLTYKSSDYTLEVGIDDADDFWVMLYIPTEYDDIKEVIEDINNFEDLEVL